MKRALATSSLAFALIPAGLAAQTYHASPRDLLSTEGAGSATYFGGYAAARFMFLDGELRGKAGAMSEIAYRIDYSSHNSLTDMGRAWTKVTIDLADADFAKRTNVFSRNPTSTPTRAFDGAMSWPTLSGLPASQPAPFGGNTGTLRVPLNQTWVYSGALDLCVDYEFSGGTLANGGPWTGGVFNSYLLDGYTTTPTLARGQETRYGSSLNSGGCASSGSYSGWGGHGQLSSTTYTLRSTTKPGMVSLGLTTIMTEPNMPVIQALGVLGSATGVPFPGITCNQLHIDVTQPFFLLPTTGTGQYAIASQDIDVAYSAPLGGLSVWFQGIWTNPATNGPLLTSAVKNVIAIMPQDRIRSCIVSVSPGATTGTGPFDTPDYNPVFRYAY